MDAYKIISNSFQRTVENITMSVDSLAAQIEQAAGIMTECLLNDGRVFAVGNGTDGSLAQIFVGNLMATYENERPALPALALNSDSTIVSSIAAGGDPHDIYARQLGALGASSDVLLCINSAAREESLAAVMKTARERNIRVILLSNSLDDELGGLVHDDDIAIYVDSLHRPRTAELQLMILHCLCTIIDQNLFGTYSQD
jgi:D-sedoheptulose 7-phosphate isomerase